MKKHLLIKEVADELDVHYQTIRRYCIEGRIKGAFKIGRIWKIPRSALEAIKRGEFK